MHHTFKISRTNALAHSGFFCNLQQTVEDFFFLGGGAIPICCGR